MYVSNGFKVYQATEKQANDGTAATQGRHVLTVKASLGIIGTDAIVRALNRPPYSYQVWDAGNDGNGNPRRVTVVYGPDGSTVAAWDDGYKGDRIPRGSVTLPTVNCKLVEYRDALLIEGQREVVRRYLDRNYPTAIDQIGRDALKDPHHLKTFHARIRACRGEIRHLDGIRSAIWNVESQRDLGYAYPATDDGIAVPT